MKSLIRESAAGNTAAMMELYDSTASAIFGVVCRILGEGAAGEEVLLDIYTDAWKQAAGYDSDQWSPLSWLTVIALNRSMDRVESTDDIPIQGELTASIGSDADPVDPPPYLRDVVELRLERESRSSASSPAGPSSDAGEGHVPLPSFQQLSRRPGARRPGLSWIAAAFFALASIVLFFLWQRADRTAQEHVEALGEARSRVELLQTALDEEKGRERQYRAIRDVLASPGSRVILLAGLDPVPGASAAIFWDTVKRIWIVTGDLPSPPPNKTYQLWFLSASTRTSAGLLRSGAEGHIFESLEVPPDQPVSAAAITLEPAGGSKQPTMPIYLLGRAD